MAFPAKAEESLGPLCCDSLSITTAMTDSCCLSVTLNNPYCYDPLIKFLQWNSSKNTYDEVFVKIDAGTTTTFVYCPMNDDDFIKFRVLVFQDENSPLPHCNLGNDQFVEGWTQFSDSINVSYCCGCPTNVNSWLTLAVEKDETNCPDGCKVTPILDIPDNITCYRYYSVAIGNGDFSDIKPISQLSTEWVCIDYNETIEYYIALLQRDNIDIEEEYYNLCRIEKVSEPCDSCLCPPDANSWLKVVVVKSNDCDDSGCRVAFSLDIPEYINCYTHYVLEKPDQTRLSAKSISSDPLEHQDFCLDNNEGGLIKVYLLKHPLQGLDSACVLTAPVFCDSTIFNPDSIPGPCQPDCFNEPWSGPIQRQYDLGNGCYINVEFWYRRACPPNNWQDIQITRIDVPLGCGLYTSKQVYQQAIYKVIQENYMDFDPIYPDTICYDIWRVIEASCWMYVETIDTSGFIQTTLIPCFDTECCLQGMEVCRDSLNNLTITPIGEVISTNNPNCFVVPDSALTFPPILPPYTCFAICEWLHMNVIDILQNKASLNYDVKEKNYLLKQRENENDISLVINCSEYENCNIRIEIYDIYGRQLQVINENSFSKSKEISLSSNIKSSGVYLFKLFLDGKYVNSGKFIK